MSNCVYIDLGDGDFIKPNFSKPPTPEMIAEAKAWGLKMKAEDKALEASGACMDCRGKGTRRQRDLDAPSFKLVDKTCPQCNGTGKKPCPDCNAGEGEFDLSNTSYDDQAGNPHRED